MKIKGKRRTDKKMEFVDSKTMVKSEMVLRCLVAEGQLC